MRFGKRTILCRSHPVMHETGLRTLKIDLAKLAVNSEPTILSERWKRLEVEGLLLLELTLYLETTKSLLQGCILRNPRTHIHRDLHLLKITTIIY